MARSFAQFKLGAMSSDPDLRALTPHAKLVYAFLVQDSYLNAAGVLMLCEQVWAEDLGLSDPEFDKALRELISDRFVIVDWRTRELLIRTFIRNGGAPEQPNVLKQALSHAKLARSVVIRRALAVELRQLPAARPTKVGDNGRVMVYPDPHACAADLDPGCPDPPPPKGSDTLPQHGSPNPSGNPVSTPILDGMSEPSVVVVGEVDVVVSPQSVVVSPSTAEAVEEKPTSLDDGFTEFWEVYPRRVEKIDALKAWRQQRRKKVTADRMIQGAVGYAAFVVAEGRLSDKIKYPASWLRAGAYDDHQPVPEPVPDNREPVDILRSLWQAADGRAVAEILHVPWIEPQQPPSDKTPYEKWITEARRNWISKHHEQAVLALTAVRATA